MGTCRRARRSEARMEASVDIFLFSFFLRIISSLPFFVFYSFPERGEDRHAFIRRRAGLLHRFPEIDAAAPGNCIRVCARFVFGIEAAMFSDQVGLF